MWLVFDIGSGSAKVALIAEGEILRSASAAYPTDFGDGGEAEQNASDWWAAVKRVCHELDAPTLLAGIVLTGQMQDVILLDENAAPVRPVVLYSDTRATAQIERIHQLVSPDELRVITGIEQSAGSLLAKLRWLDENERQSLKHASHLLFGGADFIAARMTGSFVSDSTTASTTGLWHLAEDTLLDAKLLTRLELAQLEILLPTVVSSGSCVGSLNEAAAQSLNLQAGTPVYLAPGDAGTATIGAGCGEPGAAYAYVGTSGWVAFTAREIGAASAGVITLAHPKPNHFIQVVPMMTSAGNLDWLQGIFDSISYDEIIRQALDREPSNLVFLPYLHGERAPFNDPFARGAFIGISAQTAKADLCRAALEGMIFAYRHTLTALSPQLPDKLTLIGGGARNYQLNQLFADIIGLPIHQPPNAEHAGLHGAVRAVEVSLGLATDYQLPPAAGTQIMQPNMLHRDHYDRKYEDFLAAYQALKPLFRQLAR